MWPWIHLDPATILLSFETSNEVYFVLREQHSQSTTHSRNKRRSTRLSHGSDKPVVNVATAARLIRICKGDRGGLPHVSADTFATFAKADLLCQASDEEGNYFFYTQVTSAFWDNSTQRLYAAFTTEKWAPMGSALCVYPKENIENAFSGPLLLSNIVGISRPPSPVPNSFPNICERFNAANLTAAELSIGRRMSLSFPNRYNAIEPLYKRAVLMQTGPEWIHLQVYDLPALPIHYHFGNPVRTTMIWLGTRNALTRVVLYEAGSSQVVCKLGELHTGQALNLLAQTIQGNPPSSVNYDPVEEVRNLKVTLDKLFIATNRQVLWLPLTDCSRYTTYDDCMASKDPYCGWSWPYGQCVNGYASSMSPNSNWYNTYSPSVDRRRPEITDLFHIVSQLFNIVWILNLTYSGSFSLPSATAQIGAPSHVE
ncbi:unnamed protein product [Dicrocoelium dendriticum]|nr:unnamed protein product [Dicrocoelium dendriticum]